MTEDERGMTEYYAGPGPMTDLSASPPEVFDGLPSEPRALCRTVQGLLVHEFWAHAYGFDVPVSRLDSFHARSAAEMTEHILELNPAPFAVERPVELRMVGNCRYFCTLSCALLRRAGIPARARCGFADYFEPGRYVDHWVTEYWDDAEHRWVRIDAQLDALQRAAITPAFDPADQPPGPVLPGGAAGCCRGARRGSGAAGVRPTRPPSASSTSGGSGSCRRTSCVISPRSTRWSSCPGTCGGRCRSRRTRTQPPSR